MQYLKDNPEFAATIEEKVRQELAMGAMVSSNSVGKNGTSQDKGDDKSPVESSVGSNGKGKNEEE